MFLLYGKHAISRTIRNAQPLKVAKAVGEPSSLNKFKTDIDISAKSNLSITTPFS